MKTSWFKYRGPGRIAISRGTRRMAKGFRHYPKLAPTRALLDDQESD
jgi:hypothetical protein